LLLPALEWNGGGGLTAFVAVIFVRPSMLGLILLNTTAAVTAQFPEHVGAASALLGNA